MYGHSLIFSRDGGPDRLYRVSPLLFPQHKLTNKYHLAGSRDIPEHGLETRWQTFDFGFADPGKILGPYGSDVFGIVLGRNFLAELITGCSAPVAANSTPPTAGQPGAQVTPAFLFNFQHLNAKGVVRQWSNKSLTDVEGLGTGADPMMFKSPALIPQGDTLTCMIQNLGNVSLRAQVVLIGGEFS